MKTVEELIHKLNQMPVGAKLVILDGDGIWWTIKTPYVVPGFVADNHADQVVLEVDEEQE